MKYPWIIALCVLAALGLVVCFWIDPNAVGECCLNALFDGCKEAASGAFSRRSDGSAPLLVPRS